MMLREDSNEWGKLLSEIESRRESENAVTQNAIFQFIPWPEMPEMPVNQMEDPQSQHCPFPLFVGQIFRGVAQSQLNYLFSYLLRDKNCLVVKQNIFKDKDCGRFYFSSKDQIDEILKFNRRVYIVPNGFYLTEKPNDDAALRIIKKETEEKLGHHSYIPNGYMVIEKIKDKLPPQLAGHNNAGMFFNYHQNNPPQIPLNINTPPTTQRPSNNRRELLGYRYTA